MAEALNPRPSSLSGFVCLHVAVPYLLAMTDRNQPTLLRMTQLTPPLATVNQLSQFTGMSHITTDPFCCTELR